MHIVACQLDIAWQDRQANRQRVLDALSDEPIPVGSLIILPEMFETGFTMNVDVACDADGSSNQFLAELARTYQSTVIAGVVNKAGDGKGLNQAVVITPDASDSPGTSGNPATTYTKMHPFSPVGEAECYRAGDAVTIFEYQGFKVSPLICYDLRFPERFREAVSLGAEVLVIIANWPSVRASHWSALLVARAIENQAYVVGVNRVGQDPSLPYPGLTAVIDPQGNTLAQANDQQIVLHADLDRDALLRYRSEFPFLNDIRGASEEGAV
jgi:omega-amidase